MAADSSGPIDPDRILDKTFATVKKGVDPVEVQRYLLKISNQLKASQTRVAELERQVEQSRRQSAEHDPIDPSNLTKLLGEETTRVLDAAQSAAAEIRAKAEENVARLLRDSREETIRLREETDALVARRREEAEQIAEEIRENAAVQRESAETEAAAIIEASKQQGREMVLEAQQVRQRMLDDLARRRQALRQQIEQLQAGRDRISAAYDIVRETLAVATEELDVALPEARFATDSASLQIVDSEPDATVTPIVTAEELGVPVIDVSPADRPRNVEIPAEPKSFAPKLTVVPPVQEPKTEESSDSASENAEPEQLVDATPVAEDPREGRHSSSVRVVRTSSGKAADVFARLRQEGEDEVAHSGDSPESEMTGPIVDTAIAETKIAASGAVSEISEEIEADSDADQAFIVERNAAVAAIESSLARRIKRELSDEQNELLSTLRSVKGNVTAIAFLPTSESQLERYEDIALPALADAAEVGGSISPAKGRETSRVSVGDLAADLASAIVGPLRDRLERAVSESAGDRDDLAQRIRSTFREWKGQRVDESVTFGVLSACNRGILDRLPKGSQVRWVVAAGDAPSPDCEDNSLSGATERGAAFPTGHNAPPLHHGCHCVVLPAL